MDIRNKTSLMAGIVLAAGLSACGGGDNNNGSTQATFQVEVTNITSAQVLTPLGVVLHRSGYTAWDAGQSVTLGLENLAESGNPAPFVDEAAFNTNVDMIEMGSAPFGAGTTQTVNITTTYSSDLELTVASMLANTNDAFTGVTNWKVGDLNVGQSKTVEPHVYDAGTEDNVETAATMPGPKAGGEGYNPARPSVTSVVTIHPGAVTQGDGLTTSALTEEDRWLGPAAKIVVTRTQ